MKTGRRFESSFRKVKDELKANQKCKLEHHYRGAMREVVGYLDLLAGLDRTGERFVFPSVDDIVEHCHRYEQPDNKYGKRWVEKALAELRARHIIKRAYRVRGYVKRRGWIVVHHDALARRVEPSVCIFDERAAKAAVRSLEDATAMQQQGHSNTMAGPQHYSGDQPQKPVEKPVHKPDGRPVHKPVEKPVTTQLTPDDSKRVNTQNADLTVVVNQTEGAERDGIPVDGQVRAGGESQRLIENPVIPMAVNQHGSGNVSASPAPAADPWAKWRTPGSIGAHFGLPFWSDLTTVAEGLVTETRPWEEFGAENQHALESIMREVLMELYEQPYRGPATHAQLMDAAMKRFNNKHGKKVPKAWVKLMNDYRRAAPVNG